MRHEEILHRCFRCGYCKLPGDYTDLTCPSYLNYRFETFAPGGRMWLLRAWLEGEIKTSPRYQEILYACAACGNCVQNCVFPKFKDYLLEAFIAGREQLVDQGAVPPAVRDVFKAVQVNGNPFKRPQSERGRWADGLGLAAYDGQEYLLYAGCVASYDERSQKMARAAAGLLKDLGLSFGLLGDRERCDGNEVRTMGENGLFEHLARENLALFKELGVKKIVTLSPHSYHAFRREYPRFGPVPEVRHYSQVLAERLGGWKPASGPGLKVVFHDPCYLGRHNEEYSAPRKILRGLSGVTPVEMDRSRKNALCCGGGGGNFFTDILGRGPDAPARVRAREALGTGADILVAACPICLKMLDDAVKAEGLEERLRVMDLAELVVLRRG
ncbi:MAG: (Fe-S)-binding protein [Thermodesulfobacteriota bacterium]